MKGEKGFSVAGYGDSTATKVIQNTGGTALSAEVDELELEYEGHLGEDVWQAGG